MNFLEFSLVTALITAAAVFLGALTGLAVVGVLALETIYNGLRGKI